MRGGFLPFPILHFYYTVWSAFVKSKKRFFLIFLSLAGNVAFEPGAEEIEVGRLSGCDQGGKNQNMNQETTVAAFRELMHFGFLSK